MGSRGMLGVVIVLALAGCTKHEQAMPAACRGGEAAITKALAAAPGAAALADGTKLSECLRRARSDADVQTLAAALTQVADRLGTAARAGDATAAARLGFLVGAARRGSELSNGITSELSRRIDASARLVDGAGPRLRRALEDGISAGRARG